VYACVRLTTGIDQVLLSIHDSGPGIPTEIRDSIFDPFFTTKPPGESMGLGLSVAHEMVSSFDGTIELVEVQDGAKFLIRFPIKEKH
jgi:two-component system, NtrC family, sensor kinase